ncbi:hypothetical protein EAS61_17070 [Bradyrhizobium zhanjiangense]|uniref:Uncharacterized protein n=1 Tax=Bradyrhizobium zhanjiangense TaxID=1325107 RepID=A0A4Q0QNQ9_9BRAD|nr:hypothetical protein EAS61_17070 [Bradyrhizobium zhanjiangense]
MAHGAAGRGQGARIPDPHRRRNDRKGETLKRDAIRTNRHHPLGSCLSMIFPEIRCTLFRIML